MYVGYVSSLPIRYKVRLHSEFWDRRRQHTKNKQAYTTSRATNILGGENSDKNKWFIRNRDRIQLQHKIT